MAIVAAISMRWEYMRLQAPDTGRCERRRVGNVSFCFDGGVALFRTLFAHAAALADNAWLSQIQLFSGARFD
jgi:hypothetical protein